MTVYGTSTLHDWHMDVTSLNCKASFAISNSEVKSIDGFNFSCKSNSLKSDKDKMDKLAWEALKADDNPSIIAKFKSMKEIEGIKEGFKATVYADVTVAGVTKLTSLNVKGVYLSNGNLKITGSKILKMTDFDMDPPTAVMGTIKTGDQISLLYVIELQEIK